MHLFLAQDLIAGHTNYDDDEFMEVQEVSITNLEGMVNNNKIKDAKTLIALLTFIK